jgi:hypothetical protein
MVVVGIIQKVIKSSGAREITDFKTTQTIKPQYIAWVYFGKQLEIISVILALIAIFFAQFTLSNNMECLKYGSYA